MQNTVGSDLASAGFFPTATRLQKTFGWGVFFEGIQPKLARAAVHHSVTFFIFDLIIKYISGYR